MVRVRWECGKVLFEDMKARTKVHLDILISLSNFNMPVANKASGVYFPGTALPYYMRRLMVNYQYFFVVSWM